MGRSYLVSALAAFLIVLSVFFVLRRSSVPPLPEETPAPAAAVPTPMRTPEPTPAPSPEPSPVTVCGVETDTAAAELDLSGQTLPDTDTLIEELSCLPSLRKLLLVDCEVSDPDAERIMSAYPELQVVWVTRVYTFGVRTDTTYFCVYNPYSRLHGNKGLQGLKYCTKLEALDLGHSLTGKDSSTAFLSSLTHLRYLVLYQAVYKEIPELAELKELEYLELMASRITDLSPLLGCPSLQHLNLSGCNDLADRDAAVEVLCRLTTLKRLWLSKGMFSAEQLEKLRAALPDTVIHLTHGVGDAAVNEGGWRLDESYFEMRDALHMLYMTDQGGIQKYNPFTGEPSLYEDTNPFGRQYY